MEHKTHDHRVDIIEAAANTTAHWREALEEADGDTIDALNNFFLEVEVLKSRNGSSRVEFLITCGGPTVRVFVDQWDTVEYHHSWGKKSSYVDGKEATVECQEWDLSGDDRATWIELADYMRELEEDIG